MTKSFKIEVDCANCANLVENAVSKVSGVKDVKVSFMTQKMKISFEDDVNQETILDDVLKTARKIERDFRILM